MNEKIATNKKKKWPFVAGGIAAVIIIGIVAVSVQPKAAAIAVPKEATAEKSSIVETVIGSGNLEYGDSTDIKMPTGLKIDEVLVEEGDHIDKGQTLATIDMHSLQTQLSDIQEQLDDLDEELNDSKNETERDIIKSHASGRVKVINATEGSDATDIMIDKGSLMIISIDGKMAVDFESNTTLSSGEEVDLVFKDDIKRTGNVERKFGNNYTVTIPDDELDDGSFVKLQDKDGEKIGEGTLYINNPIAITGAGGTVNTVHVEKNDKVGKGSKLITIDDVVSSTKHIQQQNKRKELMDTYNSLIAYSKTGTVIAPASGTVESINITDGTVVSVSQATTDSSSSAAQDSSVSPNYSMQNGVQMPGMAMGSQNEGVALQLLSADNALVSFRDPAADNVTLIESSSDVVEISDLNDLPITPPATGSAPQVIIDGAPAFSGSIQWTPDVSTAFSYDIAYIANITLKTNPGYRFTSTIVPVVESATVANIAVDSTDSGNTLTFSAAFPKTVTNTNMPDISGGQNGFLPDSGGMSGYSGEIPYGSSGFGANTDAVGALDSSVQASATTENSGTEIVALTIATDEEMVLAINIDELDILSISEGMDAAIVFDAMEAIEYTGTIREVDDAANTSTGVAKYTAKIYISRDEHMRAGMNATATIVIDEKKDILTIPVNAVQERGDLVFVYTQLDSDTGIPAGEVEVETGLSDGETVEILSGLLEGDTVYYILTENEDGFAAFGGMPMGGDMSDMMVGQ